MPCAADRGIAIVESVDVGQQHDAVRPGRLRDARREPVVVAEADFGGRDAVILVDDRHNAQREQPVERRRGVEVAATMFEVVEGDEHLCRGQSLGAEQFGPDLRQRDLSRRGGGLRILQARAPALGEPQPPRAQRDRARRHDRDLLPGARTRGDIGGDPSDPVAPHRAIGIDEQRRSDLDDQPRTGGGREQHHAAADSARGAARQCEYPRVTPRNFLSKYIKYTARPPSFCLLREAKGGAREEGSRRAERHGCEGYRGGAM